MELHTYFQKVNSYLRELVEFFCLRTNIALAVIATEYNNSQDISVSEELQEVENEAARTFLLGICKGEFSEGTYIFNETTMRKDALLLAKAPKTHRWTARDGKFHSLLQTRCHAHVRDVLYDFEEVTGDNFLDAVEAECPMEFVRVMEAFDFAISSTQLVYAKKWSQFTQDADVDNLVKSFITALETNIVDILAYYEEKYEKPFMSDLESSAEPPLISMMQRIITIKEKEHQKPKGRSPQPTTLTNGNGKNGKPLTHPLANGYPVSATGTQQTNGIGTARQSRSGNGVGMTIETGPPSNKYKFFTHGTVSPLKTFDPYRDVHDFRVAMQHYASNDLPLIYLISSKTNHQRQVLISVYSEVFESNLMDDVIETVGDDMDFFMAALLLKPEEFDATFLKELLDSGAELSFALMEMLCSKTVKEIRTVSDQYRKKYGTKMAKDVEKRFENSTDLRLLLCELADGKRDVGWSANKMTAETDAREMYQEFYRETPDVDFFVEILTGRSREQLRETFRTFRRFAGIDVLTALELLFSPEFAEALRLLVLCIEDRVSFFAYCINDYVQNDDSRNIIRLIVSRSEIDLVEVKAAYQGFYNIPMLDDIRPLFESKQFRLISGIILDK